MKTLLPALFLLLAPALAAAADAPQADLTGNGNGLSLDLHGGSAPVDANPGSEVITFNGNKYAAVVPSGTMGPLIPGQRWATPEEEAAGVFNAAASLTDSPVGGEKKGSIITATSSGETSTDSTTGEVTSTRGRRSSGNGTPPTPSSATPDRAPTVQNDSGGLFRDLGMAARVAGKFISDHYTGDGLSAMGSSASLDQPGAPTAVRYEGKVGGDAAGGRIDVDENFRNSTSFKVLTQSGKASSLLGNEDGAVEGGLNQDRTCTAANGICTQAQ